MRARGEQPFLPHNPASYLTDWLFDIGPASSGAMGEGPIGYLEMFAWQEITGIELMPWEGRLLRRLSAEYLAERSLAKTADRLPPYDGKSDGWDHRGRVDQQLRAFLGVGKRRKKRK